MTLTAAKPMLKRLASDAPESGSAVLGHSSAPNSMARPSRADNGQNCALSGNRLTALRREFTEGRPVGCLARLISEANADAQRRHAADELDRSVSQLLARAEMEEWSGRELARRAGIPETTLRRLRSGQVDPLAWLPKIKPALARLTQLCYGR